MVSYLVSLPADANCKVIANLFKVPEAPKRLAPEEKVLKAKKEAKPGIKSIFTIVVGQLIPTVSERSVKNTTICSITEVSKKAEEKPPEIVSKKELVRQIKGR